MGLKVLVPICSLKLFLSDDMDNILYYPCPPLPTPIKAKIVSPFSVCLLFQGTWSYELPSSSFKWQKTPEMRPRPHFLVPSANPLFCGFDCSFGVSQSQQTGLSNMPPPPSPLCPLPFLSLHLIALFAPQFSPFSPPPLLDHHQYLNTSSS